MSFQTWKPGWTRRRAGRGLAVGAAFSVVVAAHADSVILPRGTENTPGDVFMGWAKGFSTRYQQVINSEELSEAMPRGAWITGLRFRGDERLGTTISFESLTVRMSTTPARADGLSRAFAENTGPDETVVYASSQVRWVLTQDGSFTAVIPFLTPFLYNPGNGSLLIDMTFMNPTANAALDADQRTADGISVLTSPLGDTGPPLPWGFTATSAFVTRVDFTIVPEPPSALSMVFGIPVLLVIAVVRSAQSKSNL